MRVKRCGLFALSFALLFSVLSGAFLNNAHATGKSDIALQTVDKITVRGIGYGQTCEDVDISMDWAARVAASGLHDSFTQALATGSWAVAQYETKPPYQDTSEVRVFWTENSRMRLEFHDVGYMASTDLYSDSGDIYQAQIRSNFSGAIGAQSCDIIVTELGPMGTGASFTDSQTHSEGGMEKKAFLAVNVDINYPDGYGGDHVPDTIGEPSSKTAIRPDFYVQVTDKNLKARDYENDLPVVTEPDYYFKAWHVEWSLFKCTGNWDSIGGACDDSGQSLKEYQTLPRVQDLEKSVTDYGDYFLEAQYLVEFCYSYGDGGATPDYCYLSDPKTHTDDYDFTFTRVHLKIDGSTFSTDTTEITCNIAGVCQNRLELCFQIENFFERAQCNIEAKFSTGAINPSITAFKGLLTSMVVPSSPTCSLSLPDASVAGRTFPFSSFGSGLCSSASSFRTAFPLVPLLLNAILAFAAFRLIASAVNRLLDKDQSDIIVGVPK